VRGPAAPAKNGAPALRPDALARTVSPCAGRLRRPRTARLRYAPTRWRAR